ncbi:MAG: hypothetical protein ACOYVE_00715 [Melioribacter sp.]|jgi:hypothetical protein|uniref:hypothetical protein n=1 Tax=Melioribacter sp. TaxID=2052167 RepID=UPI003BDE7B4C
MLERIVNISPNTDYKKSNGNHKFNRKNNPYAFSSITNNDSVSISPATALLSSYGWKLNSFNSGDDKIEISFEYEDFLFVASLELIELSKYQHINYRVSKSVNNYSAEVTITIGVSAPVAEENRINDSSRKMDKLKAFFEHIREVTLSKPNFITDILTLDTLYADYKNELKEEFFYLNHCLMKFLETYLSKKIDITNIEGVEHDFKIKSIQIK